MKIIETPFDGLYLLETVNFKDERGGFQKLFNYPQIRSESVCSNQFNCYACVRHQIEANDALVMPL